MKECSLQKVASVLKVVADGDYSQSGGGPDRPDGDDTDRIEAFWAGRSGAMRRSGRTAA